MSYRCVLSHDFDEDEDLDDISFSIEITAEDVSLAIALAISALPIGRKSELIADLVCVAGLSDQPIEDIGGPVGRLEEAADEILEYWARRDEQTAREDAETDMEAT